MAEKVYKSSKAKEIHDVYEKCKEVFEPALSIDNEYMNLDSEEEREFLLLVSNFLLQQKQKEAIKKGIF